MSFIPYVKGQPRVERQGGPDPLAHAAAWAELLPGGGEKSGSKGEAEEGGGGQRGQDLGHRAAKSLEPQEDNIGHESCPGARKLQVHRPERGAASWRTS